MVSINSLVFDRSLVDGWYKADDNGRGQGWQDQKDPGQMTKVFMVEYYPEYSPVPSREVLNSLEMGRKNRVQKSNAEGICVLEHGVVKVKSGLQLIRVIEKKPQKPFGMAYKLSLTLLDQAFFRITMWCFESGMTGIRDTAVMTKFMQGGTFNQKLDDWGGWFIDPNGFGPQTPVMRNISEDEQYDQQFPNHPLSQLRSFLRRLEDSLSFDPARVYP